MNDPAKVEHEVSLHMQELGIKLYSRTTAEEILKYPYPKVVQSYVQLLFYFVVVSFLSKSQKNLEKLSQKLYNVKNHKTETSKRLKF